MFRLFGRAHLFNILSSLVLVVVAAYFNRDLFSLLAATLGGFLIAFSICMALAGKLIRIYRRSIKDLTNPTCRRLEDLNTQMLGCLGSIEFGVGLTSQGFACIGINHWHPEKIHPDARIEVVRKLREIADYMELGKFIDTETGKYVEVAYDDNYFDQEEDEDD